MSKPITCFITALFLITHSLIASSPEKALSQLYIQNTPLANCFHTFSTPLEVTSAQSFRAESRKWVVSNNDTGNYLQATLLVILPKDSTQISNDSIQIKSSLVPSDTALQKKLPLTKSQRNKKIISALCAFPFPLGFVGAHRVMLGTKPWVPVVYVATFGGCFGLLPLIDFCVIVFSKDLEQYENNPSIFMWVK